MSNECNCEKDSNGTLSCPIHSIPEIPEQEQKTFDSEPVTPEELQDVKDKLYGDDISAGLHNIYVPEHERLIISQQDKLAREHIIINDDMSPSESPHTTDGVICVFTPEELMILKNIIEEQSINMVDVEYMNTVMGVSELYDQQAYVRQLRDTVDMNIDNYVKLRPYTPFLKNWVKKIDKEYVRILQD